MSAARILVVDDSDDVRSFLVLLLERSGELRDLTGWHRSGGRGESNF